MAKKINLGKVGITTEGNYDPSKAYEKLCCVLHNGVSWVSTTDVPAGNAPDEGSAFWQKMASRGEQGPQGPVGPQGNSAFDGNGVEIVNNLTQGGEAAVLSAEQGKILKTEVAELSEEIGEVSAEVTGENHSSSITTGWTFSPLDNPIPQGATITQFAIEGGTMPSETIYCQTATGSSWSFKIGDIPKQLISDIATISIGNVTGAKVILTWQSPMGGLSQKVSALEDRLGKEYVAETSAAYTALFYGVTIPKGTTLKNNGDVTILLAKGSNLDGRIDVSPGRTITLDYDIAYVQTLDKGGYVRLTLVGEFINQEDLHEHVFDTNNIADKAITQPKVSFFASENLFNPEDKDIKIGYYTTTDGYYAGASYNSTGYIGVEGGKTYQLFPLDATEYDSPARFIVFYDKAKVAIRTALINLKEVTAPEEAAYMIVTYYAYFWEKVQITEGNERKPYQPYRLTIPKEYLPTMSAELEYFFLPKDIYVASGRTIELYYSQILLNYQRYNIKAQCSIGASLARKFQIKGDDAHIGNYPLTISVYDDNGNILKSASSTIHIIGAEVGNMAILPIGDSLTNGKGWLSEVRNLSKQAISFVGTRKTGYDSNSAIRHEGRSGGSCKMYNTDNVPYTFVDNGYNGVGADAAAFDSSKSYTKGDFCKYGADVYVFTSAHSGAWNTSHVRNLTQSNPFWDWNNNKFSMNHYKSFYGINYDAIMIFLGTNGINLEPMTNENGALGIKTLVENIRKEDTTTPIIVVNTIYRSGQNGIGTQGNTDGYTAQSEFKFDADRKVMLLAKAVEDMIGDMENVYICPVGFTHDSQYNFGNVKKEVNPRLTDTSEVYEIFPVESVHPQLEGYLQMADEMFSTICAL